MRLLLKSKNYFSSLPKWATVDPLTLSAKNPHTVTNFLDGKAITYSQTQPIVDPLNG